MYFFTLISVFAFVSCRKDKPSPNTDTVTIKYDFINNRAGNFNVEYTTDGSEAGEAVTSLNWSKTITVSKSSALHAINFTVHPPFEWTTMRDTANVSIKISVDGVEKITNSGTIGGINRPAGLTTGTSF